MYCDLCYQRRTRRYGAEWRIYSTCTCMHVIDLQMTEDPCAPRRLLSRNMNRGLEAIQNMTYIEFQAILELKLRHNVVQGSTYGEAEAA